MKPVQQISDERWVWDVGLNEETATSLDDLYEAQDID